MGREEHGSEAAWGWVFLTPDDVAAADAIGDLVHPDHPEPEGVLANRLRLFPSGCLVLRVDGVTSGYAVAYPWRPGLPPALGLVLDELPRSPDRLHVHDVAVLPAARGRGVTRPLHGFYARTAAAMGLSRLACVAVGGSEVLWVRHGWRIDPDANVAHLRASYGPGAVALTLDA